MAVVIALIPKLNYFQSHSIYGLKNGADNSAVNLLLYRAFGLQAEAWWEMDRQVWNMMEIDFGAFINEIGALFRVVDQKETGIYYVMKRVMPVSDYNRYLDGGGTLCTGHPAVEVAALGYIGAAFVMIIEALLLFLVLKWLYIAIIKGNIMDCFVISTFMYEVMKVFNVGGYFWITNTVPLFCLLYLFLTKGLRLRFRLRTARSSLSTNYKIV